MGLICNKICVIIVIFGGKMINVKISRRILSILFLLFCSPNIFAAKKHVGSNQEFSTIQAALDATSHGDTVFIHNGTYTGTGNKNITIAGKQRVVFLGESINDVILDCENSGYAFYLTNSGSIICDSIVFRNFTIKNANSAQSAISAGGSIAAQTNTQFSRMRFENCQNTGGRGGAISFYYLRGHCTVDTSLFFFCAVTATGTAGGALFESGDGGTGVLSHITVRNTIFKNCSSPQYGGAIGVGGHGSSDFVFLVNCKFWDNRGGSGGGAGGNVRGY